MRLVLDLRYEYPFTCYTMLAVRMLAARHAGRTLSAAVTLGAIGAIEGANAILTKQLVAVSEEQLVACIKDACGGGSLVKGYQYAMNNTLCTYDAYPYTPPSGKPYPPPPPLVCNVSNCTGSAAAIKKGRVAGYVQVTPKSEDALMDAVALGPVGVEVDSSSLLNYAKGVLSGWCMEYTTDHVMLVVGYGTDAALGVDYWKVKNSWGVSFGEEGYVRVKRNDSACKAYGTGAIGILANPVYPTMTAAEN